MMSARLYKRYVNLSNIIIRLSDGTEEGKSDAVLVNSHLDSTLPSPGAADDALAVGVMIECVRVLINTPGWEPKHAAIFCEFRFNFDCRYRACADVIAVFNNAEESLQDGSHLFSTQHPIASTCVLYISPCSLPYTTLQCPRRHQFRRSAFSYKTKFMRLIQVCSCWHHRPGTFVPGNVPGDD